MTRWVKNLTSDEFEIRAKAVARLIETYAEAGAAVEAPLSKADLTDVEVVDRLVRVRLGLKKHEI